MLKIPREKFYILADFHDGHKNICRGTSTWPDKEISCRPFENPEEMREIFVRNINKVVPPEATLIFNGDTILGDKSKIWELLSLIDCKNTIGISGNHCVDFFHKHPEHQKAFTLGYYDYLEVMVGKKLCCIFHYPQLIWRDCQHGSYNLVGHSHNSLKCDPNFLRVDTGMDVSYPNHPKYFPFSFDEIDFIMKNYKNREFKRLDHHSPETT